MDNLSSGGADCSGCSGLCCTYQKNSMKVTPLEAFELVYYLFKENRLNQDLIHKLEANIKSYRLNNDIGDGSRSFLRRNYTCPFFEGIEYGCTIEPASKPYGCLAFNLKGKEKEGIDCSSEISILEKIEDEANRKEENLKIQGLLKLDWQKAYIPIGIRDVALKFIENQI